MQRLGRSETRLWDDNVKMDLKKVTWDCTEWINLA
jgi:hypothetical protein